MHARAHSGPWLANFNHLRLSARNCAHIKLRGEFRVLEVQNILHANFFMFILLISNHTVFLVQFGINLHLWVFQKAEIALAEAARAISTFWKTHSCKLIPNWTRNRMITYTNISNRTQTIKNPNWWEADQLVIYTTRSRSWTRDYQEQI